MSQRILQFASAAVRLPSSLGRTSRISGSRFAANAPPSRPNARNERLASGLFLALSPPMRSIKLPEALSHLEPFERFEIERSAGNGTLAATWYPAFGTPRGAVILVHPWIRWGQSYFHRRGRLGALRAAGYHSLTFDLSGVGDSSRARPGFYDRDLEDALAALRERAAGLPLHLWGVSCGGYWAHPLLSRVAVSGAMFEDVAQHLIEWSGRMAPWGWPCYTFFRRCLRAAYRFMDLRHHAPHLKVQAVAYLSGALDRGIPAAETRQLARLAGGRAHIVEDAGHLESIKRARKDVLKLALETFELAERRGRRAEGKEAVVA